MRSSMRVSPPVLCACWPACGCPDDCEAPGVEATPKFFTVERILIGIVATIGLAGGAILTWSFYG